MLKSRDAMHKRGFCCPSVTFVDSVEMNKYIFKIFPPSSSHTILVFRTKRHGNILTGASNVGRVGKHREFSTNSWLSIDRCLLQCEQQLRRWTVQFTAQTATHQWIYVYHNQHGRPWRREHNLIVRSRRSEAEFALGVLYYWSYWQTRSIARPLSLQPFCL